MLTKLSSILAMNMLTKVSLIILVVVVIAIVILKIKQKD
jgi:hypothetical protein